MHNYIFFILVFYSFSHSSFSEESDNKIYSKDFIVVGATKQTRLAVIGLADEVLTNFEQIFQIKNNPESPIVLFLKENAKTTVFSPFILEDSLKIRVIIPYNLNFSRESVEIEIVKALLLSHFWTRDKEKAKTLKLTNITPFVLLGISHISRFGLVYVINKLIEVDLKTLNNYENILTLKIEFFNKLTKQKKKIISKKSGLLFALLFYEIYKGEKLINFIEKTVGQETTEIPTFQDWQEYFPILTKTKSDFISYLNNEKKTIFYTFNYSKFSYEETESFLNSALIFEIREKVKHKAKKKEKQKSSTSKKAPTAKVTYYKITDYEKFIKHNGAKMACKQVIVKLNKLHPRAFPLHSKIIALYKDIVTSFLQNDKASKNIEDLLKNLLIARTQIKKDLETYTKFMIEVEKKEKRYLKEEIILTIPSKNLLNHLLDKYENQTQ